MNNDPMVIFMDSSLFCLKCSGKIAKVSFAQLLLTDDANLSCLPGDPNRAAGDPYFSLKGGRSPIVDSYFSDGLKPQFRH